MDTMVKGGVPCLENAVLAMAQIENEAAVREGRQVYEDGMGKLKSRFPVLLGDLTEEHQRLNRLAIEAFMKRSFKDDDGAFMGSLEVKTWTTHTQRFIKHIQDLFGDYMDIQTHTHGT